MWPHKKGLGVRLSYGVYGNALVSIDSIPNARDGVEQNDQSATQPRDQTSDEVSAPRALFPRLTKAADRLSSKSDKSTQLVESQTSKFTISSSMYDSLKIPTIPKTKAPKSVSQNYIPQEIISSYLVESKTLTSNIAYDPNCGNVLQMFDMYVRAQDAYVDAMTFVTGEATSVLNIALCEYADEKLVMSSPYQLDFFDPILQVEVSDKISEFAIIAVRTAAKVFILSVVLSRLSYTKDTPNLELLMVGEVAASTLAGNSFADVRFHNDDSRKIAMVDTKGNFGVWEVNKKINNIQKRVSEIAADMNTDALSLSNWRRVFWVPSSSNKLLVLSRVKVTEVTISGAEALSKTLITSNTWSRIRDFVVVGNYGFMLTSKELILFNFADSMTRLLSWKHFLNDKDPSLKLEISGSEVFTCFVYSQINPCIIVFTFGLRDERPYSLRDPYVVRKSLENSELRQVSVNKLGNSLLIFELTTDLAIYSRTLAAVGDKDPGAAGDGDFLLPFISRTAADQKRATKFFKHFPQRQVRALFQALEGALQSQGGGTESQQIEQIQKYAYELGSGFARIGDSQIKLARYFSLFDVSSNPPLEVRDILELDDMIVQLESSLPANRLKVKSLINNSFIQRSKFQNDVPTQTHINDIYQLISTIYSKDNKESSKIAVAVLMGLALIKCQYESDILQAELDESIADAPSHVQSLLEQWDEDDQEVADQELTRTEATQATQHDSQMMPSIRLSSQVPVVPTWTQSSQTQTQTQTQPQTQSQTQTQTQSQRLPSSRILSSQVGGTVRRKRKRKGGFA